MKINFWVWNNLSPPEKEKILSRSSSDITEAIKSVTVVIDEVKKNGDKALIEFTKKFDKTDISTMPLKAAEKEFDEAEKKLDDKTRSAVEFAIKNVKKFHRTQLPKIADNVTIIDGITAQERFLPIDSAGLYVPRGRGSFPSMLYMLAVPAVEAGVKQISVVTPPNNDGSIDSACLYAAKLCGVKDVYRVGGAQAIAALAYGTESIKPVVKIVGPGSIYVTAAKRVLYGKVDVGLPAGPSESIVLADSSADPYKAAWDILIEAEHGSDSAAILVTDCEELAKKTAKEIEAQIESVTEPRKTFLKDVFAGYGGIILTSSMQEAVDVVNLYAPEHLQIAVKNPEAAAAVIRNAGEILLGQDTPFSIANYTTGPNAVLPTGGMAKAFSSVSVRDFMKCSAIICANKKGLETVMPHAVALADYEGFYTHAQALRIRQSSGR